MTDEILVGVAGLSHDHVWHELEQWRKQEGVKLVAAADDEQPLLQRIQNDFGVNTTFSDWREMIDKQRMQFLQIAGGNSESADIVEYAAAKGTHIIVEKPMAATLDQAERMLAAAQSAGTLLLINWPTAWSPTWVEMAKRVQAGEIGEVRYTRYRSAHSGPVAIGCSPEFVRDLTTPSINGAGALMDYCCYGANLAALLLGRPLRVTGIRAYLGSEPAYAASDDNAVITAQFAHALAVCEASWTQPVGYAGSNPVVYGTEGSLAIHHGKLLLQRPGANEAELPVPELVAPWRSGPEAIVHCAATGTAVEGFCSPVTSRNAQEILQAGFDSSNTGTIISLPQEPH